MKTSTYSLIGSFTDWQRRADFPAAVAAVVAALEAHEYVVRVIAEGDTFARLLVAKAGDASAEAQPDKVELAADWRAHPPVLLAVGPVLHLDDAVANKMGALYSRALPRDFLDVDAALDSGRFTRDRLIALASDADSGFDRLIFADALGALTQITDAAFSEYGFSREQIAPMRRRFAQWREELLMPSS